MQLTNGKKIIAATAVLLLADYTFVALRYLSRRIKRSQWATDDWLVTAALVGFYGICIRTNGKAAENERPRYP